MKSFILLLMIFMHVVDDYYLQGILASMKQKDWWVDKISESTRYKYDYIASLFAHAFSWSFMIMLPVAFYYKFEINNLFIVIIFLNMILHAVIDNEKANRKTINLIEDQLMHLVQIVLTYIIFI